MSPGIVLFGFLVSATAVVAAGVALARNADVVAARTRLGGLWVGSVFLAFATSLPELITDITAVRLGAPDLAAGDLFGSNMANMLILAVLSLYPGAGIFHRAALDNGVAAALAITLTAMAGFFVVFRFPVTIGGIGPGSIVLAVTYLGGTRAVFRTSVVARLAGKVEELGGDAAVPATEIPAGGPYAPPPPGARASEAFQREPSLRRATAWFLGGAVMILLAAPLFAASARELAEVSGVSATFLGTALVGLSTSLPELVTSMAAVRIGAYDLAVGNLFGSNALNMAMFAPLDLVQSGPPIFGAVAPDHALSALVGVTLMALGLASILYRAKGRRTRVEARSAIMLAVYVLGLAALYVHAQAG